MKAVQGTKLKLLIVSGRSGSGKTAVLNTLEDFGYYSIDNLPLSLLPEVVEKLVTDLGETRIALGVDARSPKADLSDFAHIYGQLKTNLGAADLKVVYVTAQPNVLIARFDATRRVHPLMQGCHPILNLPSAIHKEIELLEPVAAYADIRIDTSTLNVHQLKATLRERLGIDNHVTVNLLSFGFKFGLPIDADYVFDVRVLPNPHWQPDLRVQTGLDEPVKEFFDRCDDVQEMVDMLGVFLERWLPPCLNNNHHSLTVAIGCTGGKHRSVYISECLKVRLIKTLPDAMQVGIKHREKGRWLQ